MLEENFRKVEAPVSGNIELQWFMRLTHAGSSALSGG